MKKVNGFLIFIALISLALLGFIAYATGVVKLPEKKADPVDLQEAYKDEYAEDPGKNRELYAVVSENLFVPSNVHEIYTYEFQKKVRDGIELLIQAGNYTENNPLLILNPFCTNSQSLYVYFETEEPCAVSYTIHTHALVSAAPDFGGIVRANSSIVRLPDGSLQKLPDSTIHEFAVTGLVPGEENVITFRLVDEYGRTRERQFYYNFKEVVSKDEEKIKVSPGLKTEKDELTGESRVVNISDCTLEEGLFAVFSAENDYAPYLKIYDNDGYIRSEIPLEQSFGTSVLARDGELYVFVSDSKLVRINSFGEVDAIWKTNDFRFGNRFCTDDLGNILVTASICREGAYAVPGRTSVNDCIVTIDFTDGDIYLLVDMTKLLPEMYEKAESDDWLHLSSLSYVGENTIVATADTIDSYIRVRRIYNDPRLVCLAGPEKVSEGSAYESLFLRPDGEFSFREDGNFDFTTTVTEAGTFVYDKTMTADRVYLWALDRNIEYEYGKKEEKFGYFVKYLADKNEMSLRQCEKVLFGEIGADAKLSQFGSNFVYIDGTDSSFYEFDKDFNLIARFIFSRPGKVLTIEEQDYLEDHPAPDDTVRYTGICKFGLNDYLFTKELNVYVNRSAYEEQATDDAEEADD